MRRVVLMVLGWAVLAGACATTGGGRETRTVEIIPGAEAAPILVCASIKDRWVCMDWAAFEARVHADDDGATYDGQTKRPPDQYDL